MTAMYKASSANEVPSRAKTAIFSYFSVVKALAICQKTLLI